MVCLINNQFLETGRRYRKTMDSQEDVKSFFIPDVP